LNDHHLHLCHLHSRCVSGRWERVSDWGREPLGSLWSHDTVTHLRLGNYMLRDPDGGI
jgi:hypothetical protein